MSTNVTPPRDVSALLDAESVAVVGASDRPGSPGNSIMEYLRGFDGAVYPVHPKAERIAGRPVYRRVRAIGAAVDLAVLLVRAELVPDALADCAAAGVDTVIVCASGFADAGAAGLDRQLRLRMQARTARVTLLGPNCIGVANLHTGLIASFSPYFDAPVDEAPGGLAVVSQSGGMGFGIASRAAERGLGVGWVVTTGNEIEIDAGCVARTLAARPDCHGVIGFVEPGRGAWPSRLPVPHTVLSADGGVPGGATDVDDLLDRAASFTVPAPRGRRVAVVATSGGAAALARHAIGPAGLTLCDWNEVTRARLATMLPSYAMVDNPLDVTATVASRPEMLREVLDALCADPAHDAVLVCVCVLSGEAARRVAEAIAERADERPIVVARTGSRGLAPDFDATLRAAGVGVYPTPARAVAALAVLKART